MTRPPSIVRFEQLYLGSIAVWLLTTLGFWSLNRKLIEENPQTAANPQMQSFALTLMVATAVIVLAVSVLLWWLAARRASPVGKWLVVATEALGVLLALYSLYLLATGAAPNVVNALGNLISTALAASAALLLFRPDAKAWFADGRGEGESLA